MNEKETWPQKHVNLIELPALKISSKMREIKKVKDEGKNEVIFEEIEEIDLENKENPSSLRKDCIEENSQRGKTLDLKPLTSDYYSLR